MGCGIRGRRDTVEHLIIEKPENSMKRAMCGLALGAVLAVCSCDNDVTSAGNSGGGVPTGGAGLEAPDGWFVFWQKVTVDDGGSIVSVDVEVTEDDLVFTNDRPDCPTGVVCLAHGLQMLGFDAQSGRFHHQRRVKTGSDYQKNGTFTYANDTVYVQHEQSFSCAHPSDVSYAVTTTDTFVARLDATGKLWVQNFAGATGDLWWIFRPDQCSFKSAFTPHCLCAYDTDFLADWTCTQ